MGQQLQTEASKLQNEVLGGFPDHIPSIVLDRKPDDFLSKLAFTEFKSAICQLLLEKPDTPWNEDLSNYCDPGKNLTIF